MRAEKREISKEKLYKITISIIFLFFMTFLHPKKEAGIKRVYFKTGEIVPYDIISPFTFQIPKKEEEIQKEREIARKKVKPVIVRNREFRESIENIEIRNSLNENERKKIVFNLKSLYRELSGKLIIEDKRILREYGTEAVLLEDGFEKVVNLDNILDTTDLKKIVEKRAQDLYPKNSYLQRIFYEAFISIFRPPYIFDLEATNKRIEEIVLSVLSFKSVVLEGEKIIGAHERVTPEVEEKLSVLQGLIEEKGIGVNFILKKIYLFVLFTALFLIFYYITRFYFKEIYNDIKILSALFINLFLLILLSYMAIKLNLPYYFVPFPFLALISGIISSPLFGVLLNFLGAIYISIYMNFMFPPFLFFILLGGLGAFLTRFLKRRFHLYFSVLIIFLFGTIFTLFLSHMFFEKYQLSYVLLGNLLSGIISVSLLSLLLVLYERFFGITTDFGLLELLNINHPLLLELSKKAPGTLVHSNLIASLAEAGARAIGANPLLARAGAYFHDIGKIANPEYYAENQKGENPHDKFSPQISALILKNHIKYGVELAKKYKLPQSIIDMIKTHHGTTLMVPFYEKAKMANSKVSEEDFRYQGPKPRTKEEAVLMLADTIEAAVRSLESPTPLRIREVVEEMIKRRFLDGQFDECNITRKDLEKIKDAFMPVLISYFHERPEYPGTKN